MHPQTSSRSRRRGVAFVAPVISPVLALVLAGCAGAPTPSSTGATGATGAAGAAVESTASPTPVTLTNCGEQVLVTRPPAKLVTLNQGATEVALALGLQDRMAGTAYLDDAVAPRWKSAYDSVNVLAKEYPSKEQFLAATPDFAYASYASAFTDKAVGTRAELTTEGVGTYVSPFGCAKGTPKAEPTFENGWAEIREVAQIFGVAPKAEQVVQEQKHQLASVRQAAVGKGKKIFWYDSGDKTPFVGAGGGGPQLILDAVGATNVFADVPGGWADGSWEKVVAADPDVIVLADAGWNSAQKKRDYLDADPTLSKLKAVRTKQFVVVPFSETTPGARLVDGAESVTKQLGALAKQ